VEDAEPPPERVALRPPPPGRLGVDAAVDLDVDLQAAPIDLGTQRAESWGPRLDELLAAEPG